jgi:hypothetical protein
MRIYLKDYDREVEFPDETPKEEMIKALQAHFPSDPYKEEIGSVERSMGVPDVTPVKGAEVTLQTTPDASYWSNTVSKFFTPSVNKAKASNIVTLSEQTGLPPSKVSRNYDELTGQIAQRTYPTKKQAAETAMGAGIVAGLVAHPVGTLIALGSFMGLDELKNATVSYLADDEYVFQGGKGLSDLLKAEGFSKDAIDLMEFAVEAWAAGKASGLTRKLANAVRGIVKPEQKVAFINEVAAEAKKTKKTVDEIIKETSPDVPEQPAVIPSLESVEAAVKGGNIRNEDAKYAKASSINLDRLDTTEDVKTFIDMRAGQLADKIDKKTVSWEETRAKAESMGLDWQDVVKHGKSLSDLSAWVDATREFQMTMGEQLFDKIKSLPADREKITPEMRLDILNDIANHGEVLTATSKMSSEIGRALNIHKKQMASDPAFVQQVGIAKIMKAIIKKGNLEKEFDNIVKDLKEIDMTDPAALSKVMQKYHKAGISDMIYEAWLNMILSALKTQIVNIAGSIIAAGIKTVGEIPLAAIMELRKGADRKVFFGESTAEVFGAIQGIKDAGRSFIRAWKTEEASDMWSKAEISYPKAIPSKEITIGGKTYELGGKQIRIPTRNMRAVDDFFKALIYRASLNRQAYSIAHGEKLKGRNAIARISELLSNPTEGMTTKAHGEALYQTFNKPLGEMGQSIMKIREKIPGRLGYFAVPFIRTITNLTKYAAERTPFNFAKIAYDYNKGKIPKDELSNEIAKPLMGSIMALVTGMLVNEGYMTGGGPKDKTKREALRRTGWQPYSFKIGDLYISYNRFDPLGQIIGTAADIAEVILNKPFPDEQNTKEMVGRLAASLARNWTSKTYMQGISGILDAVSDPVRYGENFIEQFSGSLIPSMVASTARSTDPYYRNVEGVKDALQARIPVASEKLLPKRDIWGEPIERKGGFAVQMLSPSDVSVDNPERINGELVRLGVHPGQPGKKIRGVELTPEEYDLYCELAGKRAKTMVSHYIESDSYDSRRDEINKLTIENIIQHARRAASQQIWRAMERPRRMEPIDKKYGRNK